MAVHRVRAGQQGAEILAPMAMAWAGRSLHSEKRPPTQSQKPKVVLMPNSAAAFTLVVVATKCHQAVSVPPFLMNHSRASVRWPWSPAW